MESQDLTTAPLNRPPISFKMDSFIIFKLINICVSVFMYSESVKGYPGRYGRKDWDTQKKEGKNTAY